MCRRLSSDRPITETLLFDLVGKITTSNLKMEAQTVPFRQWAVQNIVANH